jgi:hypothetical protein
MSEHFQLVVHVRPVLQVLGSELVSDYPINRELTTLQPKSSCRSRLCVTSFELLHAQRLHWV